MNKILEQIRKELRKNSSAERRAKAQRWHKEKVKGYGVRTPVVRQISRKFFVFLPEDKHEVFKLCEELLRSGYGEESVIAFDWAFRMKKQYKETDFVIFEQWLKKYVSNWGRCDDFCTHAVGELLVQFPALLPKLKIWARSENRW